MRYRDCVHSCECVCVCKCVCVFERECVGEWVRERERKIEWESGSATCQSKFRLSFGNELTWLFLLHYSVKFEEKVPPQTFWLKTKISFLTTWVRFRRFRPKREYLKPSERIRKSILPRAATGFRLGSKAQLIVHLHSTRQVTINTRVAHLKLVP